MHEEVDPFLIEVPDNILSPLSELLAFVMSGQISGVVVEGLFLSDSSLFLEEGVSFLFELLLCSWIER